MFLNAVARRCLNAVGMQPLRWHGNVLLTPNHADPLAVELDLGRIALNLHLRGLLRALRINCVIDVGANAGQYALNLRNLGYAGHIASFEPVPAMFEVLRQQSSNDEKWQVLPYALGERNETASFNITPDTQFSSLLNPNRTAERIFGSRVTGATTAPVEVRRLDTLIDAILAHVEQPRVFLKMDTQGNDVAVFAGLGSRVASINALQSEVSALPIYETMPALFEAIPTYMRHGFAVTGMFPVNKDDAGRVIDYDCIMVRGTPDVM